MGAQQMPLQELADAINAGALISEYQEFMQYAIFILPWRGGCYSCWAESAFSKDVK